MEQMMICTILRCLIIWNPRIQGSIVDQHWEPLKSELAKRSIQGSNRYLWETITKKGGSQKYMKWWWKKEEKINEPCLAETHQSTVDNYMIRKKNVYVYTLYACIQSAKQNSSKKECKPLRQLEDWEYKQILKCRI